MSVHRFFLPPELFEPLEVHFPRDVSRQISSVLRLKTGQTVTILDNRGYCREVELVDVDPRQTIGQASEIRKVGGEPAFHLELCLALTQREKFEWMLQKGTELGVSSFSPLVSSRSLVQDKRGFEEKLVRWKKIVQEASEQSGRGLIPEINIPQKYPIFLKQYSGKRGYILYENEKSTGFAEEYSRQAASGDAAAALLIGPEGGFSPEEVLLAEEAGFTVASLGIRILRMETAALAACVICMTLAGEMGAIAP